MIKKYENVFSGEFCKYLIDLIKKDCILSNSHKQNWFVWLIWGEQPSQPLEKKFWNNKIKELIEIELSKVNINFSEYSTKWIQMTEYENGRWLRKHSDGFDNKTLMILLSDGFTGGETYINDEKIVLKKGDAVFFNGDIFPHEIKPVINGVRNAINIWMT